MEDLNGIYREHSALFEKDYESDGFGWLDCHQEEKCIYAFERTSRKERIVAVFNFSDQEWKGYTLTVQGAKGLQPLLSSEWKVYGGTEKKSSRKVLGTEGRFTLSLPAYCGVYYLVE